jgi:hypothetical protein
MSPGGLQPILQIIRIWNECCGFRASLGGLLAAGTGEALLGSGRGGGRETRAFLRQCELGALGAVVAAYDVEHAAAR